MPRNDGPWRRACLERRGGWCRSCGWRQGGLEVDHLISRSQGGPSVVENGLVLCGAFSGSGNRCHERKTDGELRVRKEWLDPDQVLWLAEEGHVVWNSDGEVLGRHNRLFAPQDREMEHG